MQNAELNIDGLAGPTHFYGGLAFGNVPSMRHKGKTSSPKKAALEGLEKMKRVADLGVAQAVFPPHERPAMWEYKKFGLDDEKLFLACCSASGMWMANAAHATRGEDGVLHVTPANLVSTFHRSIEAPFTAKILKKILPKAKHHPALPGSLPDEGAANTIDLGDGKILCVYGRKIGEPIRSRYPERQSYEAFLQLAKRHDFRPVFARRNAKAIDAGVFHNDVISFGNEDVFVFHEMAYEKNPPIPGIVISEKQLSLKKAVESYFFNSQLLRLPDGKAALICAEACRNGFDAVFEKIPVKKIFFVDLSQSLANGGGPACLRLKIKADTSDVLSSVLLTDALYRKLKSWIGKHYRDSLGLDDLRDPNLWEESRRALDELTEILALGAVYRFQKS